MSANDVIVISDSDDDDDDDDDNDDDDDVIEENKDDTIQRINKLTKLLNKKFVNDDILSSDLSTFRKSLNPFRKMSSKTSPLNPIMLDVDLDENSNESFAVTSPNHVFSTPTKISSHANQQTPTFSKLTIFSPTDERTPTRSDRSFSSTNENEFMFDETSPNVKNPHDDNYTPYYLTNFEFILEYVQQMHSLLLDENDFLILKKFHDLSIPSKKLYVRLFQRKRQWFRITKISYPKIATNLEPLYSELLKKEFLMEKLMNLEVVLNLMSIDELAKLSKQLNIRKKISSRKDEIISTIIDFSCKQKTLFNSDMRSVVLKRAKSVIGEMVKLDEKSSYFFMLCLTIFSMPIVNYEDILYNKGQHPLYHLLQVHTGSIIYPKYEVEQTATLFENRESLVSYVNAALLEMDFDVKFEKKLYDECLDIYNEVIERVLTTFTDIEAFEEDGVTRFTERYVLVRLSRKCIEVLEKQKKYEEAVALTELLLAQKYYYRTGRGFLYERLALDYERYLKDLKKAIEAIERGLSDVFVRTGYRLSLQQRWVRLTKRISKKKLFTYKSLTMEEIDEPTEIKLIGELALDGTSARRAVFVSPSKKRDGENVFSHVEQYVLNHYLNNGFQKGVHGEGMAVTTLFVILFWDVIFSSQKNVFVSHYQNCPLDIFMDCFFTRRKDLFESRLKEIENFTDKELRKVIEDYANEYSSYECLAMNISLFDSNPKNIADLAICIGAKALAGICELFAKDFRRRRGGFPDLILWNIDTKKCKIVEVKGPGDKLSTKQLVWLDVLKYLGLDAVACYVSAVGGKRKRLEMS